MRIYLSGPVTGTEDAVERFLEVEKQFERVPRLEVVNPVAIASLLPADYSHSEYMKVLIPILETCDFLFQLPGWEDSKGARAEFELASKLGIKVW